METIGEKIRKLRTKHNLSQERFAKKIGVTGKSISAYETFKAFPSLKILEKIEKTYEVTLSEIPKKNHKEIELQIEHLLEVLNNIRKILQQYSI